MSILLKAFGLKNSGRLIWRYPAMVLIPIFSFWTMGPPTTLRSCCGHCTRRSSTIKVSLLYTFVNAFITISMNISYILISSFGGFYHFPSGYLIAIIVSSCPLFLFSLIILIILKVSKNPECCGVTLTNREDFKIYELEDPDQEEEDLELGEILQYPYSS